MRYRVDDLAVRCGISVDTVRYYQAKGLLHRPEREGRLAWYTEEHLARVRRIRELKGKGFSLGMIGRALDGDLDASEEALAVALADPLPGEVAAADQRLSLDDLAQRTGASRPLLEAIAREGLLVPRDEDSQRPYTTADADALVAGLTLLSAGVPLSELLALAREHDRAARAVADSAVELFARYVRDPIRNSAGSDAEAAERMVEALHLMLPAAGALLSHHFQRRLLAAGRARIADPDAMALAAGPEAVQAG
ncbi:MAG: MerR family transcriptional regulator [Actinomycetota bacterium]|nr:MerR family transcriptional regulator [Actinomycetota bacterium]